MPSLLISDSEKGLAFGKGYRRWTPLFSIDSLPPPPPSYSPSTRFYTPPPASRPPLRHLLLIVLFALTCAAVAFFGTFAVVDLYNRSAIERRFSADAFCAAYGDCEDCQAAIAPDFRRYQSSYILFFNRELQRTQQEVAGAKCRRFLAFNCAGVHAGGAFKRPNIPKVLSPGDLITQPGLKSIVRQFCNYTVNPGPAPLQEDEPICAKDDQLCFRCVRHNVDCLNLNPRYVNSPGDWTCNTKEEWAAIKVFPVRSPQLIKSPYNCTTMNSEQLFDRTSEVDGGAFDDDNLAAKSLKIDYDAVV